MTEVEFVMLVIQMRGAQRKYWRTRTQEDLRASIELENRVDREAEAKLRKRSLFDDQE